MWEGVDGADSGIGLLDASCCQGNGVDSSGSMYSRENMLQPNQKIENQQKLIQKLVLVHPKDIRHISQGLMV